MKKNGFTLAEVLITLAIIGVVATMTLPALMANTGEQQAKTALKKGISTLTEIAQMNQAIDGYDYAGLMAGTWGDPEPRTQSLYAMLANRGNVDLQKSTDSFPDGFDPFPQAIPGGTPDKVVFFRDGSAVLYNEAATVAGANNNNQNLDDGLPSGFSIIFDTNGLKGPNVLSNCSGSANGSIDNSVYTVGNDVNDADDVAAACDDRTQRVIKDRFQVRLRGGFAVPDGAAAVWTYNS